MLVKLQAFIPQFNQFHPDVIIKQHLWTATSEFIYNVTQGNYLSILYDKIPVFYAQKYPKFTTLTFYQSA